MKALVARWSVLALLFAGQYTAMRASVPEVSEPEPVKLGPSAQQWLGETVRA